MVADSLAIANSEPIAFLGSYLVGLCLFPDGLATSSVKPSMTSKQNHLSPLDLSNLALFTLVYCAGALVIMSDAYSNRLWVSFTIVFQA